MNSIDYEKIDKVINLIDEQAKKLKSLLSEPKPATPKEWYNSNYIDSIKSKTEYEIYNIIEAYQQYVESF